MVSTVQASAMGVHLVGSMPRLTAEEVFTKVTKALPGRLRRIPDGEPANRNNFVFFQRDLFANVPQVLQQYDFSTFDVIPGKLPEKEDLAAVQKILDQQKLETGYDDAALESYEVFKKLRADNVIASGTRFQVSLPTPMNFLALIAEGYQGFLEPFYEEALLRAVKNIQSSIPASDLAIQWDMAVEIAHLEEMPIGHFRAWYGHPIKEHILKRATRCINSISPDVECGLHLCYGDINHQHFCQPKDMNIMVDLAKDLIEQSNRPIDWIQMPVPIDRTDEEYFAPLTNIDLGKTELFLGLVHPNDLEGTKRRIETARKTSKMFGVSTECGMGRTPPEDIVSILEISAMVSEPYA